MDRVAAISESKRYACALLLTGIGALVRYWLWPHDAGHPFLTFYVPVTLAALWLGCGPGLFATFVAALLTHLFVAPNHLLTTNVEDVKSLAMFILNGSLVSLLVAPIGRGELTVTRLPSMPLENSGRPDVAVRVRSEARIPARERQK